MHFGCVMSIQSVFLEALWCFPVSFPRMPGNNFWVYFKKPQEKKNSLVQFKHLPNRRGIKC